MFPRICARLPRVSRQRMTADVMKSVPAWRSCVLVLRAVSATLPARAAPSVFGTMAAAGGAARPRARAGLRRDAGVAFIDLKTGRTCAVSGDVAFP